MFLTCPRSNTLDSKAKQTQLQLAMKQNSKHSDLLIPRIYIQHLTDIHRSNLFDTYQVDLRDISQTAVGKSCLLSGRVLTVYIVARSWTLPKWRTYSTSHSKKGKHLLVGILATFRFKRRLQYANSNPKNSHPPKANSETSKAHSLNISHEEKMKMYFVKTKTEKEVHPVLDGPFI